MRVRRFAAGLRLLSVMSLLCAAPAAAQPARLVKDIEDTTGIGRLAANDLVAFGSSVYFGAADAGGEQLWTSDGSAAETRKIRDFNSHGLPGSFTPAGDRLYFFTGAKLWWTDSGGGIFFVRDLPGGAFRSAALGDVLIFQIGDSELWRSDGTPEGTYRLTNVLPDLRLEYWLIPAGDVVYFFTTDPASRHLSLWSTDGTGAGTRFRAGIGSLTLHEAAALEDRLFFVTGADLYGPFSLWRSDGTIAGTESLAMFAGDSPGVCPMNCGLLGPNSLTALGDVLYFVGNDGLHGRELWKSDGTAAGTARVSGAEAPGPYIPYGLLAAGARVYFLAIDAEHGMEPWSSDGTHAGTALVADATPGADSSIGALYAALGDRVVFARAWFDDLWITDGPSGAHPLADLDPGEGSVPYGFATVPGGLLFLQHEPLTGGSVLWFTDGEPAGTRVVDPFEGPRGSHPANFTPGGARMMFAPGVEPVWSDRPRTEMWVTDGTAGGTSLVAAFDQVGMEAAGTTAWRGGVFFFSARTDQAIELWKSDGTSGGTARVRPGGVPRAPQNMTLAGVTLFFSAWDDGHGNELWVTDGTQDGTRMIRDIRGGTESSRPEGFVAVGHRVFFIADDGVHGRELWVSDGTEEGTSLVLDIRPGPEGCAFQGMTAALGRVFLGAYDGEWFGLWTSDGTAAGTQTLGPFDPHQLTAAGSLVYFTDNWQRQLWRSDGTSAGTRIVRAAPIYSIGSLTGSSGFLYFLDSGELWRSNGTEAGTRRVREILPVPSGAGRPPLAAVDDLVLFAAGDGEHGIELWASDGSETGTRMVQDIFSGSPSSSPSGFTRSGGLVYFSANDGETGQELWVIPESALRPVHPRDVEPPARPRTETREVLPRP